jgi:hypothetical protein
MSSSTVGAMSNVRLVISAVIAAAINLIIYAIGKAANASMTIASGAYSSINAVMVAAFTLVPILLAGFVTYLIARRRPAFRGWARWLGVGLAVLSIPSPLVLANDTRTGLTLAAMHIVAGTAWLIASAPRSPARQQVPQPTSTGGRS